MDKSSWSSGQKKLSEESMKSNIIAMIISCTWDTGFFLVDGRPHSVFSLDQWYFAFPNFPASRTFSQERDRSSWSLRKKSTISVRIICSTGDISLLPIGGLHVQSSSMVFHIPEFLRLHEFHQSHDCTGEKKWKSEISCVSIISCTGDLDS